MKIGDYEVLSTLGKGGMGVVYRARSPGGEIVAVKVLIELAGDKRARFERERRLLEQLGEAEGFVPYIDSGDTGREPFIVMPLVSGGTLRDRIDRGPLGIEETTRLGRELAAALGRAHALGIVHRDLKPENILYTESGRALVADLGLAKHYDLEALGASQSVSMSQSGMWRGTPGYMPPEQMKDAKAAGPSSDVFALGAILYECLTGERAFSGEGLVDILQKTETGARMPLARARPGVPKELVAAIDKALAPDPQRRFPDAIALARALEKDFLAPRRGLGPGAVVGAFLALLAVGAGAAAWHFRAVPPLPVPRPTQPAPSPPSPPPPVVPVPPTETFKQIQVRAQAALTARDFPSTIELASRMIALEPRNADGYQLRGGARAESEDLPGAIEDLTRAIELAPHPRVFSVRGAVYGMADDLDAAIADDTRSLDLDPSHVLTLRHRAEMRLRKGQLDEAIEDLDRAIQLAPDSAEALVVRGLARDKKGDLEAALEDYTASLKLGSARTLENTWRAIADLKKRLSKELGRAAEAFYERKQYDIAIALATKSIALYPENASSYLDRGVAFAEKGCGDLAIADYTKAIELMPTMAEAYSNRGAVRAKKPDLQGAYEDYGKAIEINPTFAPARINRGLLRDRNRDSKGALEDLKKYLELSEDGLYSSAVKARIAVLESRVATGR